MPAPYTGGCQCGAFRFEVTEEPLTAYVCHCSDCQKQSGSAFGMAILVANDAIKVLQGETRTYVKKADSGREAECLFCPICGNRIFHRGVGGPPMTLIKTGLLDDPSGIEPVAHFYTRNAAPWVVIPDGVLAYETQPTEGLGPVIEAYQAR